LASAACSKSDTKTSAILPVPAIPQFTVMTPP
jgi:hypothetical protein